MECSETGSIEIIRRLSIPSDLASLHTSCPCSLDGGSKDVLEKAFTKYRQHQGTEERNYTI